MHTFAKKPSRPSMHSPTLKRTSRHAPTRAPGNRMQTALAMSRMGGMAASLELAPRRPAIIANSVQEDSVHEPDEAHKQQRTLTIMPPSDRYEQEADRVADEVTAMSDQNTASRATPGIPKSLDPPVYRANAGRERFDHDFSGLPMHAPPRISAFHAPRCLQRQGEQTTERARAPEEEEEERPPNEPLLLKRESTSTNALASLTGGMRRSIGSPLPALSRAYMEPRFRFDFSNVRVHTGPVAHRLAVAIGAAAFTSRNDIFFKNGRFSPATLAGRRLLAHELTHVVQQSGGSTSQRPISSARAGMIQRRAEVHVNLEGTDRVKVYRDSGPDLGGRNGLLASSGRPGYETVLGDKRITWKQPDPTARTGDWGLRYFATFHGEQGFHSRICWPRRRMMCDAERRFCTPRSARNRRVPSAHRLIVDGRERSHGCVRLQEDNARALFEAVQVGTRVKIYRERTFRPSPFGPSSTGGGGTHTVVAGDTLGGIAQQHNVGIDDLRRANNIPADSDHIEIGQALVIPGVPSPAQSSTRRHTVAAGETLSEIAEQYGVTTDALRQANGIDPNSSHIETGQELVIPSE